MSMAENRRNRPEYSDDGYAPQHNEPSDPLAELARLIGQSDPFTDAPRSARRPPESFRADDRPAPDSRAAPDPRVAPEWLSRPSAASGRDDYAPAPAPRYADPARYQDQYQDDERAERAPHDPQDEHGEAYADDGYRDEAESARREYHPDGRYHVAPPPPDYDHDGYYEDGHMPPSEENYAPPRRRGGLVTVAAVIGLAVVGTAGAFAYRSFTGGAAAPSTPPVIKADPAPVKVVPPSSATAAADPNKPFQDRISGSAERVVPREEQPVSLPVPPRPTVANPQTAFAPSPGASNAAPMVAPPVQPGPASNEPKRVRTQVIRPTDLAATEPPQTQPAQVAPQPAAPTRGIAPAPAGKQSGPMTIAPQSETPAHSSRTKMAARTPAAQAAGGPYVVQVSAQKTEDEARASFQSLQQKYPGVLGGREATIRRADLGQNQTWYRVQIGAFATSEQATTFCNSLKDAGGQCIVQKN